MSKAMGILGRFGSCKSSASSPPYNPSTGRHGCGDSPDEDCGECDHCSIYCDVCASFYNNDDPCQYH